MGDFRVISAVTAVLKYMLEKEIDKELELVISLRAPHTIESVPKVSGLNIFLFNVTRNLGYVNYDTPMRSYNGELISKPLVGLNLDYLLTPYAVDNDEILVQQILASTIRVLHERSVLSSQIIDETIKSTVNYPPDNEAYGRITESDLSGLEGVRLIDKPLSVEEISKLWSSCFQTNYRLSIAYTASAALIEGKSEPIQSLPVKERKIFVSQFRYPYIERIQPSEIQWDENEANRNIKIVGKNLDSDKLTILVGESPRLEDLSSIPKELVREITNNKITVELPQGISAGIKTLKVVHGISEDNNGTDSRTEDFNFESNTSNFVLVPRIITEFPIQVVKGTKINLDFRPALTEKRKIEIIIGQQTFPQIWKNDQVFPTNVIDVPTDNFPLGKSLFCLRINGATSFLLSDPDPNSPNYKKYTGPELEVIST